MRRWQQVLVVAIALSAPGRALAQATIPELRFVDPAGFYRSATYPPADFSSTEVNASLQVYPFRLVTGDIRQAFSQTLLRDLIDVRFRELEVLPGARLDQFSMPGADVVLRARFQERGFGQPRERQRLVVVSGNALAILDASAISMASWQRIESHLAAFWATVHIDGGTRTPTVGASSPSAARAVAGVYMGYSTRYNAVYGQRMPAWFYYLFSADGRVYRTYDDPGNDPSRFDFAAAQRADPVNSGQYTIRGDSMVIRLGPPNQPETFEVAVPTGNAILIKGITYERQ
jgi:hypothetical protein